MQLTCTEIRTETHDVNTYLFESDQPIDYIPGQFLPLQVEIDGESHSRCYSLASIPGDNHYALTIKRVSGGLVSNHLADNVEVGDSFHAQEAAGEFHYQHGSEGKLLMLSAGCGITPVYSMLRARLKEDPEADIVFVHSARTPSDRIYPNELEQLAQQHPNLRLCWVLSQQQNQDGHSGRLDAGGLLSLATDIRDRTILMCGPQEYMTAAQSWFDALGVAPERVFHEIFAPVSGDNAPESSSEAAEYTLSVSGREVSIDGSQTVLEALEANGLPIFAACRSGVCGSCKCKGEADKLERSAVGPLTPQELEQGYFLACACNVTGNTSISLP